MFKHFAISRCNINIHHVGMHLGSRGLLSAIRVSPDTINHSVKIARPVFV